MQGSYVDKSMVENSDLCSFSKDALASYKKTSYLLVQVSVALNSNLNLPCPF